MDHIMFHVAAVLRPDPGFFYLFETGEWSFCNKNDLIKYYISNINK